jgi:hypothetical protein
VLGSTGPVKRKVSKMPPEPDDEFDQQKVDSAWRLADRDRDAAEYLARARERGWVPTAEM